MRLRCLRVPIICAARLTALLIPAVVGASPAGQVVSIVKVATSPNPSVQGNNVVITVVAQQQGQTPTGSPPPATGSITVTATCPNQTVYPLGTVSPLDSTGAGTLNISNWQCTGGITLVATYTGDASYLPATSSPLVQTVNAQLAPTTTTMSATPNPSSLGQAVTLSAIVKFTSADNSSPTGKVSFVNASTSAVLGTGVVQTSGAGIELVTSASMLTSSLAPGSYTIQAVYSGDNIYAASTSTTLIVTVGAVNPAITTVVTAGGYKASQNAVIAQNTWIEIHGSNLASSTLDWSGQDFSKGLPTSLGGVTATVNNKPAAIYYVSPSQVNILTPLDNSLGQVPVQLNSSLGATPVVMSTMMQTSPSFLALDSAGHVAARHADYSLAGPVSLTAPGYTFTPVKPGELVLLYGVGFGQTNPPVSDQLRGLGSLSTLPLVTIGGLPATVQAAGISGPGLYQLNVSVPAAAPDGDLGVTAIYNGITTQTGIVLTIQH